jgi:L-threonylcarbamoyladenylate synthase
MFLLRDDLQDISAILSAGGIICYPTDTVWGIGCDATNADAVDRLTQLKQHDPARGYIALVDSIAMLKTYIPQMPPRLETLLAYHNRPLTMIYEHPFGLPAAVRAADGTVAIRLTTEEFSAALIQTFGKPIISTCACIEGLAAPLTFGGISSDILSKMDYVVKYRQDDKTPGECSPIARLDQYQELEFVRE